MNIDRMLIRQHRRDILLRVGRLVRERRKKLGWSQTDLANAANVSLTTVHRLERAKADTAIGKICDISAALGLNVVISVPLSRGGVR